MRISDWSSDVCSSDLNNPWALTAVAAHAGHAFGQAPWSWYIGTSVDKGSNPPSIDLMKATRFLGNATLREDRRALELFEQLYGPAEKTTLASTKLIGTSSKHGTDRTEEHRVGQECVSKCRSRRRKKHTQKN